VGQVADDRGADPGDGQLAVGGWNALASSTAPTWRTGQASSWQGRPSNGVRPPPRTRTSMRRLFMSGATVKAHVSRVLAKLGLRNR
jgi:hypothetical protein